MYECPWSSACIFVGPLKASKTSSVAAVTSAIAAAASRAVSVEPATVLAPIEPETSSASTRRWPVGSTTPNAV